MVSSDFFVLHINLKGENKMGNLIQYIAQENPDKNEPWQTPVPRNNLCERKSTILSKPKYTNPNPHRIPTGEIAKSGLEGFGQGVLGGMERGINATLAGNYNNISNKYLGGGYQKRQKALEQLTEQENLGKLYKYSNYAIEIGARGLRNKGINLIKKKLKLEK